MEQTQLITGALALCIAIIVYNTITLLAQRRDESGIRKRVTDLQETKEYQGVREEFLKEKKEKEKKTIGLNIVSEKLENDLIAAGIKISGDEFLKIWLGVAFLPGLFLYILGVPAITILAFVLIGIVVPILWVNMAKSKQVRLFNKQLGDSLMIMSNSLRAGYSFQQAMASIAKDMAPPISTEFQITLREMDMGLPMDEALNHLVDRTRNEDVKILVSAVLISSQVGANLADVLDSISGTIRDRLGLREQVKVLTAQGRMSGYVVGALPIFLFLALMILNPEYIGDFIHSPLGIVLLIIGAIMELLGFLVISKMVDIKY